MDNNTQYNDTPLDTQSPDFQPQRPIRQKSDSMARINTIIRAAFGIFMVIIYVGMGILLLINFFNWYGDWAWTRYADTDSTRASTILTDIHLAYRLQYSHLFIYSP